MPKNDRSALYKSGDLKRVVDLTDEEIVAALREGGGILKQAAYELKCDRSALSRRITDSEELTKARRECFEEFIDLAESQLFKKVKEGDKVAIIFFLKCQGKDRGYVERLEQTGKDGEPLGEVVIPVRNVGAEDWLAQNQKMAG